MNPQAFQARLIERWLARVVIGPLPARRPDLGPCWLWTGAHNAGGYPRFSVGLASVYAHRWAYEQVHGAIPADMQLDHFACDTPGCVNPAHVRPATGRENCLRGDTLAAFHLAKTHCKWGHPFDAENTYLRPTGGRGCRACSRERARRVA